MEAGRVERKKITQWARELGGFDRDTISRSISDAIHRNKSKRRVSRDYYLILKDALLDRVGTYTGQLVADHLIFFSSDVKDFASKLLNEHDLEKWQDLLVNQVELFRKKDMDVQRLFLEYTNYSVVLTALQQVSPLRGKYVTFNVVNSVAFGGIYYELLLSKLRTFIVLKGSKVFGKSVQIFELGPIMRSDHTVNFIIVIPVRKLLSCRLFVTDDKIYDYFNVVKSFAL
ncbi:hypothetical protein MP228_002506 [Amoeboaphelidium protococcarum]|nr:hypothetical protein MP228_002506 [Amoeboaphelidium protococcarum]